MFGPTDPTPLAQEAERLGFDAVFTAEAYGSDAFSPLCWIGAHTSRIKLATGIAQISARTPACTAMAAVALDPAGGDLVVRGRLGNEVWERHVEVNAVECGVGSSAVLARWAREAVADAEMRFAGGSREEEEVIERLGLDFGIATRRTSWVAISDEATVDPTQPTRRVEMPQMLPLGLSAFGLGLTEELGESFGDVMSTRRRWCRRRCSVSGRWPSASWPTTGRTVFCGWRCASPATWRWTRCAGYAPSPRTRR